jgi:hypothetical protein
MTAMSEITVHEDPAIIDLTRQDEALAVSGNEKIEEQETAETEPLIADQADEGVYIEYVTVNPEASEFPREKAYEPVKITIEYIASGKSKGQSETDRKKFYSKMDNMKSVNEVLGDIRTYKDRLFALDFKKENKTKGEENSER